MLHKFTIFTISLLILITSSVFFMIAGTLLGKKLVDRVSERAFTIIVEVMLVAAGLNFLIRG